MHAHTLFCSNYKDYVVTLILWHIDFVMFWQECRLSQTCTQVTWTGACRADDHQPPSMNKLTSTNIKKCVNDRNLGSFVVVVVVGSHFYTSQFCSSYVCKECKVQHVGLMEKLIRGQSSHPNLLTHFHPSHYAPLHLPLSVSHSPTAVNELMLSHTLCLQLYLFYSLQWSAGGERDVAVCYHN